MTPTGTALTAHVEVDRPGFTVSARLHVDAGQCLAILGRNGAGKSTVLGALAGLVPLARGRIRLGERLLDDRGAAPPVRVAPEHRRITMLEQKPRLFPHLSIADNLAYGPRSQGLSKAAARAIADEWLERIDLPGMGRRRPRSLSGGQQQRVAIARALAARPEVLLLDEPFAALDAAGAPLIRRMLADELARTGTTSVLVTHDLSDAWQWAGRCLVLDRGVAVEEGTPAQLAAAPRHPFTAALAGYSVVHGRWEDGGLVVGDDVLPGVADGPIADGRPAVGVVVPHAVTLSTASGALRTRVRAVSVHAGRARVETDSGLTAEVEMGAGLPAAGEPVWLTPTGMRVLGAGVGAPQHRVRVAG